MYEQMFSEARRNEINASDRMLRQRMTWHEITRVDRLENALRRARLHLNWPTGSATTVGNARVKAS